MKRSGVPDTPEERKPSDISDDKKRSDVPDETKRPDISKTPDDKSGSDFSKTPDDVSAMSRRAVFGSVLFAALLLGGLLFGMYRLGVFDLRTAAASEETAAADELYDSLRAGDYPADAALTCDVAAQDYFASLSAAPYYDEYTAAVNVTLISRADKPDPVAAVTRVSTLAKIWYSRGRYRVELYSGSDYTTLDRVIVCDGEKVSYTDRTTYRLAVTRVYPVSAEFSLAAQAGLPELDQFLSGGAAAPGVEDLDITLVRTQSQNVYRVTYTTENPKQKETLLVSLEYGLIVSAQTEDASGDLVYSASASYLSRGISAYSGDRAAMFTVK